MASVVERPPEGLEGGLKRPSPAQIAELKEWLTIDTEDAIAARTQLDSLWVDLLRQYDGRPRLARRDVPIPNAPNTEIPLGAIAADAIYSQSIDVTFQVSPTVTVRPLQGRWVPNAKGLQRWVNWGVANEWGLRPAADHAFLDNTQLGTAVYYVPWVEKRKKFLTGSRMIRNAPHIRTIPVEDFFVPGGAPQSLHDARWVAYRQWLTLPELQLRAKFLDWDIDGVSPAGARSTVRLRREMLGRTQESGEASRGLYEILDSYVSYDIDNDGIAEDILVTWDRTSQRILRAVPNPFDRCRPFEAMVYQPRPHMFYGVGVVEMLRVFQDSVSETHNERMLNMKLANCRMWAVKEGSIYETMEVHPSKVMGFGDPSRDIQSLQMADVYPSSSQAEAMLITYAERRSGLSDLQTGASSSMGTRTPGITAMSMLQASSQRFTPAYDAMRTATAGAVRQCLYRYQERAMLGDKDVDRRLEMVLGRDDAQLVLELLRREDFDDAMSVELTASSATINRDSDRQNAMLLVQTLGQYYQQVLQLMMLVANPQVPEVVRKTGEKILGAAAEAMDRMIRTFDQVRDPAMFIVELDDVMKQEEGSVAGNEIAKFLGQATQAAGGMGGGGEQQ